MRKKIIAGNWKMNKTVDAARDLFSKIQDYKINTESTDVLIFPPSLYLSEFASKTTVKGIYLGCQHINSNKSGAFTGEISAPMLKSLGLGYCLVGHSERRKHFGETDLDCREKVKILLANEIHPILCVGEELEVREGKQHFQQVIHQLTEVLSGIGEKDVKKIIIAYEPIWAIGTGKTETVVEAGEMHTFIRKFLVGQFSEEVSENISILYGGSVNASNAKELMSVKDIDGVLVGGASLEAETFGKIVFSI